ncbi:HAD-IIA family hydrolase [Williamsia herbipolensis]|uniref:HAD-IIA family hydrolase n=1 Tax=Williamsia herbipolensis TaxID=1603258 RepID=A0AAU4K4K4_9NOCA|nr:HAD-IIA family hydrolase [Williamsia herbipolensis]
MTDREQRGSRATDHRRRDDGPRRGTGSANRPPEPSIPDDVVPQDLDGEVRRDLLTLDRTNADAVARHLVMTSRLLDEDPALALEHARAARRRAGRIAVVRETAGIAAYNANEWTEALSELRAARRMSGGTTLLPLMADCERGLGRPDRAIDIARSDEGRALTGDEATEMKIVESGARIDLGDFDKAVVTLQAAGLDPSQTGTGPARLFYAYATALHAAGRTDDAVTWFMNAAAADVDDVTDAELRLMELTDPEGFAEHFGDEDDDEGERLQTQPAEIPQPVAPEPVAPEPVAPAPVDSEPVAPAPEPVVAELVVTEPVITEPEPTAAATPTPNEETDVTGESAGDTLAGGYDAILCDLDGTLFAGGEAIDGAQEALAQVTAPAYFVTNNASRRAPEVADHLTSLGFTAQADQVVTSAQSAAALLAEHLEPGSRALVVGTDGLAQEIREVGIGVTRSAADRPQAVVQGHSPDTGWAQLSEAVLAIADGALWIACNIDPTLPSERGFMIGNGSMVAAVAHATGATPLVAGKPAEPLMRDAIARSGSQHPLVVGDRLDTDIAGAVAVGADSLLVLTGVASLADAVCAAPDQRPTHIGADLRALTRPAGSSAVGPVDGWTVSVDDTVIRIAGTDGDPDALPAAVLHAAYASPRLPESAREVTFVVDDDTTAAALKRYGVDSDSVSKR